MLRVPQLTGGLTMFFFQFMIQAGIFFIVPLFLSVALGLTALETGVRLLPLSVALLFTAVAIPKYGLRAAPRTVVRWGLIALRGGCLAHCRSRWGWDRRSSPCPCSSPGWASAPWPRSSGAVTVSAVPDKDTGEVGGLQNTMTNLGASLGTASPARS